jgi:GNAT superfamily N-acetyltransferase
MQIRAARVEDANSAIDVVRRSITELCGLDHHGDASTLSMWLGNKTPDNMRRWIADHTVLVAVDREKIAGGAALRADGEVLLNYVAPEARFRGASKALMQAIEVVASGRGIEWLTLDSSATALRFYLSAGCTATSPPQRGFGVTVRNPMRKRVVPASVA